MRFAIIGRSGLGGCRMRGADIAARIGIPFYDSRQLPPGKYDTLVICKYWPDNIEEIRSRCRRLILDPLDCWCQTFPLMRAQEFWKWCQEVTGADAMISTTPSVTETMQAAGITTYYAPHHADQRIGTDWRNPRGPVVYAGGVRYLGGEADRIAEACKAIGREFIVRDDKHCYEALRGASVVLSTRFGVERTPLNIWCKPGVKLANAARAGIPVLATRDPAIYTLCRAEIVTGDWIEDLQAAIKSEPCDAPHGPELYCNVLRGLM